ncbi:MAG: M14 family zinc carboxypeptidase, partial [Actinomycetota bacterium]
MKVSRFIAAIVLPGMLLLGAVLPATASPVCSDPPREPCGGRIFPEAETTVSFLQHDNGEYVAGMKALEKDFPRFVKVRTFSQMRGRESLSAGGRDIWMVEITDFEAPERNKIPVAVSLSVHGPERAGLEGGARYAEDLARWATDEPDHELRNGTERDSTGMPVSKVLERVHLYLTNVNPDGWAQGDVANGGVFVRGNDNGVDLNREFPTTGWTKTDYTPLSEPESRAWDD